MPRAKDIIIDVTLTNFVRAYKFEEGVFAADQVCPKKPVKSRSGKFHTLGQELLDMHVSDTASDRSPAQEIGYEASEIEYWAENRKLKTFVSDDEIDSRGAIEPMQEASILVTHGIKMRQENRIVTLAAATSHNSTPGTDWDTSTAIVSDVAAGKISFLNTAGFPANVWLIPDHVAEEIAANATIQTALITASALPNGYEVLTLTSGANLPSQMMGMDVVIPTVRYNSAEPGAARVLANMWGDDSYIFRVDKGMRSNTWAVQVEKLGVTILKWRENDPAGWWVMAYAKNVLKEATGEAIHRFIDVT